MWGSCNDIIKGKLEAKYSIMKINFKLFLLVSIFSILIPISVVYAAQGTVRIFFPSGTTNPVGAQVTVVGTDGSGNNIQAPAISTTLYPSAVTPPSATISTSPTSCTENCNVTVSWNSSNVENIVRIYRNGAFWINATANASGSATDWTLPAGTYEYCIRAVNNSWVEGGNLACATTTVNPLPQNISVSITASPQTMTLPTNSTNLTWTTTGSPTSCTASGSWSGTKSATGGTESRTGLTAGTYTYTITCSKSGVPNAVASVTVTVNSGSGPTGVDLKISTHAGQTNIDGPAWTYSQGPYTISWGAVSGATACNINGTNVSTSGGSWNLNMLLGQTTANYTLSCSNSNGTTIDTATVHVPPPPTNGAGTCPAPGTTGTFSWTAPSITLGGISTWNTFYTRARVSGGANLGAPAWDDNFVGTSKNFSSVVGTSYDWWVHTKHTPTGSWSDQIGGSFNCQNANYAQCDGTWRQIPSLGYTPSQPIIMHMPSTKTSSASYKDIMYIAVRGTDNRVYERVCAFGGGAECIWNSSWSQVPGTAQTTDTSPWIWTGGTNLDLLVRDGINNMMNYNDASGWSNWFLNSTNTQQEWGKPFRMTDKNGRVWQVRKNADNSVSYMCGATGCVSLPFNSTNSSFTPATVNAGDPVTVYCDYNLASNNAIGVSSTGLTGCTFQSFNGKTQARFNCTAGSTGGSHNVSCVNNSGTSDNVCTQSNSVGSITVNAPITPITVTLTATPSIMTLPTNSTQLSWTTTGSPTSCTASGSWSGTKSATGGTESRTGLTAGTYTYTITCSKSGVPNESSQAVVTVNSAVTPTYSLTVIKSGQGTVTSSSNPAQTNINCGSVCTISYDEGTSVDLTAEPGTGRIFTGWSGGGCTGRGTCSTTINGNTTIIANFAIDPNYKEF